VDNGTIISKLRRVAPIRAIVVSVAGVRMDGVSVLSDMGLVLECESTLVGQGITRRGS
jgi:hypothetical protein